MEAIVIYLGKVAIAIFAFYVVFQFLFSYWKNFSFNRQYMLGSMIIPFILPLITFTTVREAAPAFVFLENSGAEIAMNNMPALQKTINYYQIILITYFTGLAFLLLRLLAGHMKAIHILKKSQKKQINGIPLYIYPKEIHPFAFFNKIAMPESATQNPAFDLILKHELVHTKEKHWIDNLLSEIICAVQWFNPFSWLMKNALKTNLEFQADKKAIACDDAETYQMALVSMANNAGIGTFLTAINSSDLKTRIKMMKKKTGNKYAVARQLVVLPLLAILVLGLSNREVKTVTHPIEKDVQKELVSIEAVEPYNIGLRETNQISQIKVKGKVDDHKGGPVSSVTVIIKGNNTGTITDSKGNYVIAVAQENEKLIFTMPGYVKQEIEISGRSEINVTLQPDNNSNKGEKINSGNYNEENVPEEIIIRKPGNATQPLFVVNRKPGNATQPLFVVNGVIMEHINHISPDRFESISVLKNESATALYGEKGKSGAVIIALKGQLKPEDMPEDKPLILVNGFATSKNINDINPEDIESINVLKGVNAISKYGNLAKNGAIEITLKEKTAENTVITNPLHLRRHIASEIKYPSAAQQAGQTGKITLYAEFDKDGKLARISETEPESSYGILDEVVIVGYQPEAPGQTTDETLKLLREESKRVIRSFPKSDIPEFRGKWVKMQFNFALQ
jgi:beta-lactamase regulating signal transducer with metallopeptidase domain